MGQLQPHPTCTRQGRPGCPRVSPLLGAGRCLQGASGPLSSSPRQGQAGGALGPAQNMPQGSSVCQAASGIRALDT